jgi:hypothetical protein|tara:strand:+ start:15350 stop:15559 length:210 start_codon:yes stop_codon:yes gene_type:complete
MKEYKIKQHQRTKEIVSLLGQKAKVVGVQGMYAQGKYEANRKLALFVDNKTQTLYRVPMSMVVKNKEVA